MPDAKRSGHALLGYALGTSNKQFVFADGTVFWASKLRYIKRGRHYVGLHYNFCWMFGQLMTNVGGSRTLQQVLHTRTLLNKCCHCCDLGIV